MKWKDENGQELEGNIDEYKAFKALENGEHKEIVAPITTKKRRVISSRKWFNRHEDSIIKKNFGKIRMSELLELLPERSEQAIYNRAKRLHIGEGKGGYHMRAGNKNAIRGRFIATRANTLMRQDKTITRERAYSVASAEWATQSTLGNITRQEPIKPEIFEVCKIGLMDGSFSVVDVFSKHGDAEECLKNMKEQYNEPTIAYVIRIKKAEVV